MARTWTPEERAAQSERAKRLHAEGRLKGGRRLPSRPKPGDDLLDTTEEYLRGRMSDPEASDGERDRAAAALIRLARVPGRTKARTSPAREALKSYVVYQLPSRQEAEAAYAALTSDEAKTDYMLDLLGLALEADPATFLPLVSRALGCPSVEVLDGTSELRRQAFMRTMAAGSFGFGADEDEAIANLDARVAGETERGGLPPEIEARLAALAQE